MPNNNPLILIVDDHLKNIQVLGNLLSKKEFDIGVAMNGKEAIDFSNEHQPDLILLDIMMPEMNGFEVCEYLKSQEKTADIPIIFLTAKTETEDVVKGFEIGAVDYITKPFNRAELLSRVDTQLENKKNREVILQKNIEQMELLHILCHDLYNPFAAIHSALEIMDGTQETLEVVTKVIKTSSSSGMQVIDLVRQMRVLMDKSGALELSSVNLLEALTDAISVVSNRLEDKKIQLNINVPPNLNVIAEAVSLKNSVINNIITNAIKFSFPGSEILIHTVEQGRQVHLMISDEGIGMPTSLLDSLFDITKATSRLGTSQEQGTGFGMPLVEKFMLAFNGTITVQSREKKEEGGQSGTTVDLCFQKSDG